MPTILHGNCEQSGQGGNGAISRWNHRYRCTLKTGKNEQRSPIMFNTERQTTLYHMERWPATQAGMRERPQWREQRRP